MALLGVSSANATTYTYDYSVAGPISSNFYNSEQTLSPPITLNMGDIIDVTFSFPSGTTTCALDPPNCVGEQTLLRLGSLGGVSNPIGVFSTDTFSAQLFANGEAFTPFFTFLGNNVYSNEISFPVGEMMSVELIATLTSSGPVDINDILMTALPLTTPVPPAFSLFATGLAGLGLFGWRRKRKNAVAIATA